MPKKSADLIYVGTVGEEIPDAVLNALAESLCESLNGGNSARLTLKVLPHKQHRTKKTHNNTTR